MVGWLVGWLLFECLFQYIEWKEVCRFSECNCNGADGGGGGIYGGFAVSQTGKQSVALMERYFFLCFSK